MLNTNDYRLKYWNWLYEKKENVKLVLLVDFKNRNINSYEINIAGICVYLHMDFNNSKFNP